MRRPWLRGLVPVYRAGMAAKDRLVRARKLAGKVVSVGSLSAGGAGKTPVVMLVVDMLRQEGFAVDVLSRGYRRTGLGVEMVDVDGDAGRFGDEPMLIARRMAVPVWVGADRVATGRAAEAALGGGESLVHVLDDGFQHRRLERDVDVVLLTREDVEDSLLPGGNLREEMLALRRADIVVLREDEAGSLRGLVPEGKPVWVIRRYLEFQGDPPERVVAFCGIARPEGFLRMLDETGVRRAGMVRFKDHHRYEKRDAVMLAGMARLSGADCFCTTEKDAVKLSRGFRAELAKVGPLCVAELGVELVAGTVEDVLERLR